MKLINFLSWLDSTRHSSSSLGGRGSGQNGRVWTASYGHDARSDLRPASSYGRRRVLHASPPLQRSQSSLHRHQQTKAGHVTLTDSFYYVFRRLAWQQLSQHFTSKLLLCPSSSFPRAKVGICYPTRNGFNPIFEGSNPGPGPSTQKGV